MNLELGKEDLVIHFMCINELLAMKNIYVQFLLCLKSLKFQNWRECINYV